MADLALIRAVMAKDDEVATKTLPDASEAGVTLALVAAARCGTEPMARLLAADSRARVDWNGQAALISAILSERESLVRHLLAVEAVVPDPDAGEDGLNGLPPLAVAAATGSPEVVQLLLAAGPVDVERCGHAALE